MNSARLIRIAIAGNPNSGKSTIFNAITGARQKVANYAGVTVEKKEGVRRYKGYEFIIYDLPGTYSLSAYSLDEVIARDFIIKEKPDLVIDVLDATNIERNLYLCLQFQELRVPVIAALNIVDQAQEMGIHIDEKQLSRVLGIPFIKTVGTTGKGIEELLDAVISCAQGKKEPLDKVSYGPELEQEINSISSIIERDSQFSERYPARWLAIKLIEKDAHARQLARNHPFYSQLIRCVDESIRRIDAHFGRDAEIVVSEQRYGYIHGTVAETVHREADRRTTTEKVDVFLLDRFLGLPVFIFVLWSVFQLTFKLGEYPMRWLEAFFGWLSNAAMSFMPDSPLRSLVVDGVIGGVGGVFSFVPLVVILFVCISFLEDTGYMARAAFIMDKFLHIFGLHGQSFMPMMLGFGCSVPAVMAARTLKSQKDRIITVLVIPFMSCGAKLPVYVLFAGAFFSRNQGNAVLAVYLTGVALSLFSSLLLRKTVLRGEATPFVMELPPYRMPTLNGILWHVWEKVWQYFKRAGTVILAASIIIWAITSFPKPLHDEAQYQHLSRQYLRSNPASTQEDTFHYIKVVRSERQLEYSVAGRMGKFIEPLIRPLGFDWKIGVAALTGFAAKEISVSTLGILYKTGAEGAQENESLRQALRNDKTFNPLVGFVFMLFTLIIAPCFAALAAIRAEIGWKWLTFSVAYTFMLAWLVCFAVYQLASIIL